MKKEETKFKEKLLKKLKEIPGLWYSKIQTVCIRGTPDILICFQGKFFSYELKTDLTHADPLQEYTLSKIRDAGGVARVVSPKNVREILLEDFYFEW